MSFLISSAVFWLEKYHIDGIRVDAVASMLYLDYSRKDGRVAAQQIRRQAKTWRRWRFLQQLNEAVFTRVSRTRMMIAEESTAWPMVTQADLQRAAWASTTNGTWAG